MGIVTDVKGELKKLTALKLTTHKKSKETAKQIFECLSLYK